MRRQKSTLIFIIALIALTLAISPACGPKKGEAAKQFSDERLAINGAEKAFLLKAVRQALTSDGVLDVTGAPAVLSEPYNNGAIVSLFVPEHEFFIEMVRGNTLLDSVAQATLRIYSDSRFKRIADSQGIDNGWIKVDVVDEVFPIRSKSTRRMRYDVEPGIFGLILATEDNEFYQAPEELIYRGWYMEGERRMNGRRCIKKQLRLLCRKAGLPDDGWKNNRVSLYRFNTISFKEDVPGGEPQDLFRGNVPVTREITTEMLLDTVYKTGRCVADYTDDNGMYRYIYWPDSDTVATNYSKVRHAGSVWGLFRLYRLFGDDVFLKGATEGLRYMRENLMVPQGYPDIVLFAPEGKASLGGQALALLTYMDIPDSLMTDRLRQEMHGFGNALLLFTSEDGRVYKEWSQVEKKRLPDKQPIYYPGEAMLALIRFYERTKDPRWLQCAKRIGEYQIQDFRRTGKPDNWIIQAMSRLYLIDPQDRYREMAFAMADYNVNHQHPRARGFSHKVWDDYIGGYDNSTPPRSTPAGSRTEATDEAYILAVHLNDTAAIERYGQAIYDGIWFDMNQMYRPGNVYFLPYPEKALGCMRGSPVANDTRIDYNQHVFVALLNGFDVVYQRELARNRAAGKPDPKPLTWKIPLWPEELSEEPAIAETEQPAAAETTPAEQPATEEK
ncbi:MAG: AMMECR1 domain-containing protein [Candidatus Alcyoniella australis]|nr:AMMECR1 domain-containing protein [Candidatus Alcyoniella australis]